ncbi:MarR family winged helix-turn-helix transcriptional regulator [Amycolatopsis sp. NBC_01480]|uniref:MarR family winged helix-turn-helix transcriptional regulator n=1 Tax=Amycolatopsis sp. NBC_01480 TaxID=2903562 RepID=UPI002E2A696E|nr:MarR family transcriptional regulator [Amycolatopsis sp. NBC_01480]
MSQAEPDGPLDEVVGYVLKRAAAALRTRMDAELRPLGLTVPQYACLEVLARQPGLSNAELARAVFVSRQSMNLVLRGLQDRGLVARPASTPHGRALPSRLTPPGREQLRAASTLVKSVEQRMLTPLSTAAQDRLRRDLTVCADALAEPRSAGES